MTTLADALAHALQLDAADVCIVISPTGALRVYVPATVDRDRLQIGFLRAAAACPLSLSLVSVGSDDRGAFVGYEYQEAG